jgi:hypothetical protein
MLLLAFIAAIFHEVASTLLEFDVVQCCFAAGSAHHEYYFTLLFPTIEVLFSVGLDKLHTQEPAATNRSKQQCFWKMSSRCCLSHTSFLYSLARRDPQKAKNKDLAPPTRRPTLLTAKLYVRFSVQY